MQEPMKITVDNWYAAIQDLSEGREYLDFNFTAFNFKNRKGYHNKNMARADAAAGLAWLQYISGLNTEIKSI